MLDFWMVNHTDRLAPHTSSHEVCWVSHMTARSANFLEQLTTPAALVDIAQMQRNTDPMQSRMGVLA